MDQHFEETLEQPKTFFDQEDLPPQLFSFAETLEEGGDIMIDDGSISEYHKWQETIIDRKKAYGEVWNHLDWQNEKLLSRLQINKHGREHGNRVAGLTGLLYLAIRGHQKAKKIKNAESKKEGDKNAHRIVRSLLTVAEPAGQLHDIGYSAHLAGMGFREIANILSSGDQRGTLPNHAEYGARLAKYGLEPIYKTPSEYRKFFRKKYEKVLLWTGGRYHDTFNQCIRAIEKHTTEQKKSPLTEQQTAGDLTRLVYCADKMDFMNRAPSTFDPVNLFENGPQVHQRLNVAVTGQAVRVSQKEQHVELLLDIDPSIPESLAREAGVDAHYDSIKFKDEFFKTYGNSFEEIETILKVVFTNNINFNGDELNHSTFSVSLRFPDGTRHSLKFLGRKEEHQKEIDAEKITKQFMKKMRL